MGSLVRDRDGVWMVWVGVLTLDFRPTHPVVILSKFASFVGRREGGGRNPRGSLDCPENWHLFFNHENKQ